MALSAEVRAEGEWVTASGIPVPGVTEPAQPVPASIGRPGTFPYTRGIDQTLYRDKPWVMGQYSGHSSARETNERIKRLLASGQRGFSIALDLPTQVGLDSDDPRALGEVGRVGVPIDTLADMLELLEGIPFDQVEQIRTTANAIGPIAVALFIAVAEQNGVDPSSFRVLLQNDVLKEYVARGTYIFPPRSGLQFSVDVMEYCATNLPSWEPIEFCGYHIRDSGSSAIQEVGVALANAQTYLDEAAERGVDISSLAPHLFMFLSAGMDLFEEVAKFRAARRLWSRLLQTRYSVPEDQCGLRIFSYTLGSPLPAAEPMNNVVRVAYEALAAVLGGAQTLATSSYDEALGLPSNEAVHLSLRTQQILAFETGVRATVDPLGGSYHVERLTDEVECRVRDYVASIETHGGALGALESGWLDQDLTDSAYRYAKNVEDGSRVVVGVNAYQMATEPQQVVRALAIRADAEAEQIERLEKVRAERSQGAVAEALDALRVGAERKENSVPLVLNAIRAYATVGEICTVLKKVWGEAGLVRWHPS
jgi:methylmalonyl-CoA mutase N-terminal domain/subunit